MDELKTGGVVSIVGHPKASDGRYNYFKGNDGNYYITKDWIKCLNQK